MDLFEDFSEEELVLMDIQFFGLEQMPWDWVRGKKTERLYLDGTDIVIKDSFSYTMDAGNRAVTDFNRKIEWYKTDGSIGLTKDIAVNLSDKKLKSVNREIRQGRLDYLESAAENLRLLATTLPEPTKSQYIQIADNIDALFVHYQVEVGHYIQRGTMEFEDAVNNEADATILDVLAIPSRPADASFPNGLNVKQSIMYQLVGVIP